MGPYVREMIDAGMFFSNRVLKDFKEKYAMCDGQCFLVGGISCHWTFVGNQIVEWASPWLWLVLWVCVSVFAHSCFGDMVDIWPACNKPVLLFTKASVFFAGKNVLLVDRGSFFTFGYSSAFLILCQRTMTCYIDVIWTWAGISLVVVSALSVCFSVCTLLLWWRRGHLSCNKPVLLFAKGFVFCREKRLACK